jgi:hypothetical protein
MKPLVLRHLVIAAGAAACAAVFAPPALAAATGSVVFTTPTGAVNGDQPIPVEFTVTLDASSSALITDANGNVTSGYTTQDLIDAGIDPALVASSDVNNSFGCSGTFNSGCQGPPYDFQFAFGSDGGISFAQGLDLEPGTSTTLLFGTFLPTGGSAPSGHYTFYDAAIFLQFYDAQNNHLGDVQLFHTCTDGDDSCAFTRDVTGVAGAGGGVPEPAAWALMLAGFGGLGVMLRRRRLLETLDVF